MKYTAINIGPILRTFDMVRKPRDIWAASYMFSHLMECIVDKITKTESVKVFSPVVKLGEGKLGVGLFPDRVYCKGEWDFRTKRESILKNFAENLGVKDDADFKDYFNIMCVTIDGENKSETQAITEMNHLLDCLELNGRATSGKSIDAIWNFITKEDKRKVLYDKAFQKEDEKAKFGKVYFAIKENDKAERKIETAGYGTLAEYSSIQLSTINPSKWEDARKIAELIEKNFKTYFEGQEDVFFSKLNYEFPNEIKSYHKYICVVQADGDNMGKTFSHKDLADTETSVISAKLVEFGKNASAKIYQYGGLPIYAGGDDLLFLAPVVGKTMKNVEISEGKTETYSKNIFDLLKDIDECFEPVKKEVTEYRTNDGEPLKDDKGNAIIPSMSFGVSITYYKFPLYEALASARHLLFGVAKNVDGKNAIAWRLQKNSGSSFEGAFTKDKLLDTFESVILKSGVKDTIVAAVSHKIRENQQMLQLWLKNGDLSYTQRNLNFFKKYMDYDERNPYKTAIIELLNKMYEVYPPLFREKEIKIDNDAKEKKIKVLQTDKAKGILTEEQKVAALKQALRDDMFKMVYSMIRTAKFISGEEVKDE